jgi:hypothetical protein
MSDSCCSVLTCFGLRSRPLLRTRTEDWWGIATALWSAVQHDDHLMPLASPIRPCHRAGRTAVGFVPTSVRRRPRDPTTDVTETELLAHVQLLPDGPVSHQRHGASQRLRPRLTRVSRPFPGTGLPRSQVNESISAVRNVGWSDVLRSSHRPRARTGMYWVSKPPRAPAQPAPSSTGSPGPPRSTSSPRSTGRAARCPPRRGSSARSPARGP